MFFLLQSTTVNFRSVTTRAQMQPTRHSRIQHIVNLPRLLPDHKLGLILQRLFKLEKSSDPSIPTDEKVASNSRELWVRPRRWERDLLEEEGGEEELVPWERGPGGDVVQLSRTREEGRNEGELD